MNRRKFVKTASTAAAAAFVLPRFSIAKTKNPSSKLNVAFVGVGEGLDDILPFDAKEFVEGFM